MMRKFNRIRRIAERWLWEPPAYPRDNERDLRRYTDEDIVRFLEEDRLDEATARRIRALLQ